METSVNEPGEVHPRFRDRAQAGARLAARLAGFRLRPNLLVLALPRGGVPVARVVAGHLHAPLDVFLVRKLGVPRQPELGFGAIAEGGVEVLDSSLVRECGLAPETIRKIAAQEQREIERRGRAYRGTRPAAEVRGRDVIVIDDGLATGSTMLAAVRALRKRQARRIVVAVPVGARQARDLLAGEADQVVCIYTPEPFYSVGAWYADFTQLDDRAVEEALAPVPAPAKRSS
jgi:predicted phosphoribosyltransferase